MKILIVKLSSLSDVVHAMPAVQDILRALPHAQIDGVVERGFDPLLRSRWLCSQALGHVASEFMSFGFLAGMEQGLTQSNTIAAGSFDTAWRT